MNTAAELPGDWDDISDAELVNIQSEHLGSATRQPLPDSESDVTGKHSDTMKRGDDRLTAVCAMEPGHAGSPRKRRRPGLGRNPMERFWRTHLAVTQVCSQTWCELQVAYGFEIPHVLTELEERPEVTAGASIHLSREMEVQKVVAVPVLSREDRQAIPFLNLLSMIPALQAGLRVRELPVLGLLEGVFLMGVVDELCYSEKGELVLTELKTRRVNTLPGPAQVKGHNLQVRLYKLLFDSLVRGDLKRDHVISHLRLRPEQALGRGVLEHAGKLSLQVSTFGDLLDLLLLNLSYCELPAVDRLSLEYCHQGSGASIGTRDVPFAEPQLREELRYYLSYWTGHREPRGVDIEEVWKCNTCPYKEHCEWKLEEGSADMVTTPTKRTITHHTLPQDTGHAQQDTLTTPTNQTQDTHSVTKTDN
ncbi:hypothetical protein SKAU_G00079230 [Synaphobranchus kaupii]|uniref:Exonuclease V n=1 Tax=Synaphobranchus kaupii TaxID=118154 RepID=A0A9Q1FUF3_SYNKA|nr:hypothetical protein SKAU_G00079230 [Synaphobranchus kaupii]